MGRIILYGIDSETGDKIPFSLNANGELAVGRDDGKELATENTLDDVKDTINLVGTGNVDEGTATGGDVDSLTDTDKDWSTDLFEDAYLSVTVDGTTYVRQIDSNTSDTLNWTGDLGTAVSDGDEYEIKVRADAVNVTDREDRILGEVKQSGSIVEIEMEHGEGNFSDYTHKDVENIIMYPPDYIDDNRITSTKHSDGFDDWGKYRKKAVYI